MTQNFTKMQRRAVQYWFVDGLAEIGMAATMLLLALLFGVQSQFAQNPLRDLALFVLAFAGTYGIRLIILRVKEQDTYPRTGYVANKNGWEDKRTMAAIIAFTVLLVAAQLLIALRAPQPVTWMPIPAGVILAFIFLLIAFQAGLTRFVLFAVLAVLAGGGLMFSGLNGFLAAAVLCVLLALVLFVSGMRIRRDYLRQNPTLAQ